MNPCVGASRDRLCGFTPVGPRRGAARVLHDDFTGLTLLIREGNGNDREFWRGRPPLMVVFSFVLDHARTEHLPIIETPHYGNAQTVSCLVRDYAQRVPRRHRHSPQLAFAPAEQRVLAHDLGQLSTAPLESAIEGFFCAVAVCLDSARPRLQLIPGGLAQPQ